VRLQTKRPRFLRTKGSRFFPQRAFFFQATPGLARGQKARCSPCASYNDPVSRTKGSRFFPQRAFFSKRPQVLHAAKKARCSPCAYNPNDPVSCGQKAHAFPLNVRFQATPDLARGLKPAAHRALTTTKQQINNQQQTTNATPKFLLIPRSVLLTLVTRDRTQGAVFSVTS
jgi:hypothetical protein